MDALKKQNAIGGFIPGLAKRDGYAVWEKSQVKHFNKIPTYNRNGENDDVVEVFTPIVQQDSNFVNGFFFSKIVGDSVELHLYRGNDYDLYPFGKTDSAVVTAELITCKLVELDALAFDNRKYKLKDSSLFKRISPVKPGDSSVMVISVEQGSTTGSKMVVTCWYEPSGDCNCLELPCDWPNPCRFMVCSKIVCKVSHTESPAGWPPDPPISTGGGGSNTPPSAPNCTATTNCGQVRSLIIDGKEPCGGCGPGPVIVVPLDAPTFSNQQIIDSLQGFPCAQDILRQIPNINSQVRSILQTFLNDTLQVDLKFRIDSTLVGTLTNGETHNPQTINGIFTSNISLNPWILTHSTREYIFTTILHEALHAYMDYQWHKLQTGGMDTATYMSKFPIFWNYRRIIGVGSTELIQHENMAMIYVNFLADALQSFNTNISNYAARQLAWGGLQETTLWFNNLMDTTAVHVALQAARDTSIIPPWQQVNFTKCP